MVTIRALRAEDKDQWQRLYDVYQGFYGRPDLPQGFFDSGFARLMSGDRRDFQGLVAADGGQLLGLTHYVFHPTMRTPAGTCYLQDLFTVPEARGKGVGRALIEAVCDAARSRGALEVYWLTAEDNYPGRMLYDRVASRTPFIKYGRAP